MEEEEWSLGWVGLGGSSGLNRGNLMESSSPLSEADTCVLVPIWLPLLVRRPLHGAALAALCTVAFFGDMGGVAES